MSFTKQQTLIWLLVLAPSLVSCATWHSMFGGGGASAPAVAVTPPPPDLPANVVLVANAAPSAAPATPRPALPGDSYRDASLSPTPTGRSSTLAEGKNADYIPVLASVDPSLYGIVLVTVEGAVYEIGAARDEFSIQSVSKPFTAARAIETAGADAVDDRIGVNATGQPFNSILAVDLREEPARRQGPRAPRGQPAGERRARSPPSTWSRPRPAWTGGRCCSATSRRSPAAGSPSTRRSTAPRPRPTRTTARSSSCSRDYEVIKGDPMQALDLYTRQCSVSVNARDLAVMGATLANGGRNPLTRIQVVSAETAAKVLAIISTAGLYETTGEWLYRVGVPAKSGVGGGIVAVVPGRFAVATFAPPLDAAGNSVRGQRAIGAIIKKLGGNVFASKPAGRARQTSAAAAPPAETATVAGAPGGGR